ncbi:MAG TPA: flagellar filament capping protein FliD [Sedimentibacter sp.]|nr:flagellar filament capping protein FliD [Sedimentibacter sp.]HPY55393.1 flagellar filament capping protein FliD [Sedimentibacter sp.]HQC69363.1 flagellar filament capping protein FliD [Sedimentibacter sp.]HQO95788.1 flagellar filament capping protein FliD [Sedimentibacter sp.]
MSILSTNLYGSSVNKGMGGLMSGLDTDDLVNQMTAATRNKINKQYQAKQKLLYKQEAYREISSKLLAFNNKYFSYSSGSKTNILSPKFFESYTYKSSSDYVSVTGNADVISNFKINSITSVAKAATYTTNSVSSQSFSSDAIIGNISEDVLLSSSITFDFNGVKKAIALSEMVDGKPDGSPYTYDAEGLADFLNTKLAEVYGAGRVNAELDASQTSIMFSASGSTDVFSVSNISNDLSILTGIKSGDSNRLKVSKTIGDIYGEVTDCSIIINGKSIDGISKDMSISEVLKKINKESDVDITYSNTTDKFVIVSKDTGKASKIEITGALADKLFGGSIGTDIEITGEDTVMNVTIHGQDIDITRSTANFSIDGINIELSKNAILAPEEDPITFDVINNTDEVIERVKQFIDDYNEIIDLLGTKTKEKPRRDYPPLTPEQQDEMKEKEIENWLKEAKKGVLFGDKNITSLLNKMRASMSGMTSVSDLALSNIGISAASMDTSGKLVFNEEKFREKLIEAPDQIASLFTGIADETDEYAKSGIANQILDILRENIGAMGTSGKLIEEAGLDTGRSSDQNNISLKIKDYDEKMKELKKSLERERQRYWNQFSALEQSLNKLNAQSSWLMDMMGGY